MNSADQTNRDGEWGAMPSPTIREHADLKERVTRLEASLGHLPAEVQRLSRGQEQSIAAQHETTRELTALRDAINSLKGSQPTSGQDALMQTSLAIHRAVEALTKREELTAKSNAQQSNSGPPASLSEQVVRGLATAPTLLGALLLGSILSPYIRKALGLE